MKQYKESLDQVQKENARLKEELKHKDQAILAERNAFQANTISEIQTTQKDFNPENVNRIISYFLLFRGKQS